MLPRVEPVKMFLYWKILLMNSKDIVLQPVNFAQIKPSTLYTLNPKVLLQANLDRPSSILRPKWAQT